LAFTTLVYVVVAVLAGKALGVGSDSLPLSIAAAALVAVTFQPLRERAQRLANRIVYGRRATPYEVLARFSARVGEAYATEDVLPRTARVLAEGVHAARAVVWLRLGDRLEPSAAWPPEGVGLQPVPAPEDGSVATLPGDHVAPVHYRDELLGALAVEKPRDEPLVPDEIELLDDLASQAGLVLANVRMTADLEARLALIERQAAALKASRQRIVAAQDAERRRLERNIHDGAQQQLVALAVKLRLADTMVDRDPAKAHETSPFAPRVFAMAVQPSTSLREASAFPGTRIARIAPPDAMASLKTPKPVARNASVRSTTSMPNRVSGRSLPYRRIASSYVMRGHGFAWTGFFPNFSKTAV
jgi:signal transduction histidine kinase